MNEVLLRTYFALTGICILLTSTPLSLADTNHCSEPFSLTGDTSFLDEAISADSLDRFIHDLSKLRLRLDLAKSSGESSIALTKLNEDYPKKEKELVAYLEKHNLMTRTELIARMRKEIGKLQAEDQRRKIEQTRGREVEARRTKKQEQEIIENAIDGTRAIFHRIEPGRFKMGEVGKQVDVTLTKSFDMMSTEVTQIIWKKIAELANQKIGYKINKDPSQYKGATNPVESVSWNDVKEWLMGLNELSKNGDPALLEIIPSYKQGDEYRLPTEAEWEFVVRGLGQYNETYHFGNDATQLGEYAWYIANSGNTTHPVAEKLPLIIDGKEFYDMHGNIDEWVEDEYSDRLPGGTDPYIGRLNARTHVLRGGSFSYALLNLCSSTRIVGWSIYPAMGGFRLARTVKP